MTRSLSAESRYGCSSETTARHAQSEAGLQTVGEGEPSGGYCLRHDREVAEAERTVPLRGASVSRLRKISDELDVLQGRR